MTLQICDPATPNTKKSLNALLGSRSSAGNLVSQDLINALDMWSKVNFRDEVIAVCTNGDNLNSLGSVVPRLGGLRKMLELEFYIVGGGSLPWEMILSAETCTEHHLLNVGCFGAFMVIPKQSKGELYLPSYSVQIMLTKCSRKERARGRTEKAQGGCCCQRYQGQAEQKEKEASSNRNNSSSSRTGNSSRSN
jgi:hypothetical protein